MTNWQIAVLVVNFACIFASCFFLIKIVQIRAVQAMRGVVLKKHDYGAVTSYMMLTVPTTLFELAEDIARELRETCGEKDQKVDDVLDYVLMTVSHEMLGSRKHRTLDKDLPFGVRLFDDFTHYFTDLSKEWLWSRLLQWRRQEALRLRALASDAIPDDDPDKAPALAAYARIAAGEDDNEWVLEEAKP